MTITGTGFDGALEVRFGDIPAVSYSVLSDNMIKAVVGNGASGNVSVITHDGTAVKDGFIY